MIPPSVIRLNKVSKYYRLYRSPKARLKESIHPLGKKYHTRFFAIKNITLDIRQGEILGIVGKNGAGKTSMLKLISRLLQPTSGELTINGNVTSLLGVGTGLSPKLTGIQNIVFNAALLGYEKLKTDEYIQKITDFAEIGDYIHQPVKTYSSGMKSRLGFAMAININPEILVVDEVLAVGDALFKRKCFAQMESLFKAGKTIIYVSHNDNAIKELCTRAILIDKGELILDASPKSVTEQYQRLLFAKPGTANDIRDEIVQMHKKKTASCVSSTGLTHEQTESPSIRCLDSDEFIPNNKTKQFKPYLIENLVPKSSIEYKQYDVDIYDMHIRTIDGTRVNALVTGENYIYCFKVRFHIAAENISIGSRFKTMKGLILSGKGVHGIVKKANPQDLYLVEYSFKCNLMKGTYYIDTGVSSQINEERFFLNRIVDAAVFKVQDSVPEGFYGLIYLNQNICATKKD